MKREYPYLFEDTGTWNSEELTVRGNEFGVNSINHEVNKEHGKLGNWDSYVYWILTLILETIWYTCQRVTMVG